MLNPAVVNVHMANTALAQRPDLTDEDKEQLLYSWSIGILMIGTGCDLVTEAARDWAMRTVAEVEERSQKEEG